ncbi:MAG: aminotransferase class V-fold PLP-dependent enzyme [Polyangia bacterium]
MDDGARRHFTLDPDVTFLNHGSFGACPRPVLDVQSELRARMEREPVRFFNRELEPLLDEARAELAAFVGAPAGDLVFLHNATTAVNAVLSSLRFEPGDEILVTDHGYPACANAARRWAARAGACVVTAAVPFPLSGGDEIVAAVLAAVSPRTRLALLDHVTSPTGLVLPLAELVAALAARGIDTLVDGAHAPGMLPLRLSELAERGAAYYTGNLHKWCCAPKGAAFLYVRRDRQDGIHPTVTSHGASSPRRDRSRLLQEFDWVGTDDYTAALCVPAALRFLGGLVPGGWDVLRQRNRELARSARRELAAVLQIALPCPDELLGALAALPLPAREPDGEPVAPGAAPGVDPLQARLYDQHRIQVPVIPWPQAPRRLIRISAQIYNQPAEYTRLGAALLRELADAPRSGGPGAA